MSQLLGEGLLLIAWAADIGLLEFDLVSSLELLYRYCLYNETHEHRNLAA